MRFGRRPESIEPRMGSRGLIPTAPAAALGDREPTLEGDGGLRRMPLSRSFILSVASAHPAAGE
jgi:hypothetical protein